MVASSDASGAEVFFADVDASSALLPHDSASALVEPGGDQDDGFYNTPPHPALVDLPEGIVPDELGFFRASSRDSWEQITAPSSATSSLMTGRPTEEGAGTRGAACGVAVAVAVAVAVTQVRDFDILVLSAGCAVSAAAAAAALRLAAGVVAAGAWGFPRLGTWNQAARWWHLYCGAGKTTRRQAADIVACVT